MKHPIDESTMDFSVSPADSFYHYCNGSWLYKTKIPAHLSSFGAFTALNETVRDQLTELFHELSKPGSSSLLAELFLSGLDTESVENAGFEPIKEYLELIDSVESLEDVYRVGAQLTTYSYYEGLFFGVVFPDLKDASNTMLFLVQSGLGLPDRDYYLLDEHKEKQEKYKAYLSDIFGLVGAEVDPSALFEFEKKIAEISLSNVEMRDIERLYNKMSFPELKERFPAFPFDIIFKELQFEVPRHVSPHDLTYFDKLAELVSSTDIQTLKIHMKAHLLTKAAPFLSSPFENAHFDFFSATLRGTKEKKPRLKAVTEVASGCLSDLISQLYVEKYFTKEAKKNASDMVYYIIKAFEQRIKSLDWMTEETKVKALQKLGTMQVKIGFPDKWKDFSSLEGVISRSNTYASNVRAAKRFEYLQNVKKLNKPVDKTKWDMPPYVVNAYYNPTNNECVFPAAILQPPFYYPPTAELPHGYPALGFGAIGDTIAHELSHGFDDMGRKFDFEGNMNDWWKPEDTEEFTTRSNKIVEQFNNFKIHGKNLNGELTLGENIADFGGVSLSFLAFQNFMKDHREDCPEHPKFTQEQQFFIAKGQIERNLVLKESALERVLTDPHSPAEFRVNAPLSVFPEFHKAFGITSGNMFVEEEKRGVIW
ncbi:hypothetical protein HDV06_001943 [Boothiomyces sp. JEL0866]|nr:hypothetical protein HDV06_001943 [Boothiomyces sp. JEL0866]